MNLNTNQVKLTNDASTVSKGSAAGKGYFQDAFIEEFVEKKKSRAALIHLGYYTRAVIINKLITDFIEFVNHKNLPKFQIISCGSGFDTTYWRLSEANLLDKALFIEIDFQDVIQRKILLIKQSEKLTSYVNQTNCIQVLQGINKLNFNYFLLEADLSNLDLIEKLFSKINVDYIIPTLILSECVITYMKESDSRNLVRWMAEKFTNCAFINYEQIHPDDGFGQVMLQHFNKLQSTLFSVTHYPDCESHFIRYKNVGFKSIYCLSEWDALLLLTTNEERKRVFCLEPFDEFEEFHLKCVHYVIAIVGNGISSSWISAFPPVKNPPSGKPERRNLNADRLQCDLELFRHSYCSVNEGGFVFGGCNRQNRSSKTYKVQQKKFLDVEEVETSDDDNIYIDMVHGSAVSFEVDKVPFVCLYGGRRSPNKVSNDGSPILFKLIDNEFIPRLVINKGNVIPRYRSPMVCLKSGESVVRCWIFGGRTTDLNQSLSDFWELIIEFQNDGNMTASWKPHEKNKKDWPCSRMSHSFTACQKRHELFMIGGLTADSYCALNDMWKWCCRSESWEEVQLNGNLLPRYGHTAHLKDGTIYLIGGVNTLAGVQPGLAVIDLKTLTVKEYTLTPSVPEPVLLFNHTSELVEDGDDAYICILGGGGNCFSFGTYLNQFALSIKLNQLS